MEPNIITYVYTIDLTTIFTVVGTGIAVIGFVYAFLRNFKTDINSHIDKLEKRMDNFDQKIISIEERIFLLATGKSLSQAILEEKMKEGRK